MVDVPRHLEPSDAERLHTFLARMTPGGAGGQSRAVGPILSRVSARAAVAGAGEEDTLDATESKIDQFPITGTGTSTFTLTFNALDDSWNVSCGYPLEDGVDYSISGQTVTMLQPTVTFIGASGTYPKTLQVQYDYLAGAPTTPNDPYIVTDPFAYYRFFETSGTTLADSSGNSRDMTLIGSAHTFDQAGPILKALEWGTGAGSAWYSAVQYSHSTASMECWVKVSGYPAATTGIMGYARDGHGSTTHDKNLYLRTDGKVGWYVFNGAVQALVSPSALSTGVWHHVAATVGPTGGQILYIDGVAVNTNAAVTTSYTGITQNILLRGGGTAAGGAIETLGTGAMLMAEAAFYDSEITAAYVLEHYEAGS